jgi:RNA polymerase sigma-70 factor (ECF subfamily)
MVARDSGNPPQAASPDAHAAVRSLFDAHYGPLAGWAARLLGDDDLAHDVATEAFVRLLRTFDTVEEPRAWLYAVTANLVRDHWRRTGRERVAYRRFSHDRGQDPATDRERTEPRTDAATRMTVREVVLALPDSLSEAVLLYYYADLPVAVVAARLGKSEGTVKRDLFDARRRMAALLEDVR